MVSYVKVTTGDVPAAKLNRALKTGKLSLTAGELSGGSVTTLVHPSNAKLIKMAQKKKKGVNITVTKPEVLSNFENMSGGSISGGGWWSKVWGGIKKLWQPVIKPALSAALDVAAPAVGTYFGQPALAMAARKGLKTVTGVGMAERMAKVRAAKKNKKSNKVNVMAGSFLIN